MAAAIAKEEEPRQVGRLLQTPNSTRGPRHERASGNTSVRRSRSDRPARSGPSAGPLIAQARKLTAMPFIMIVVTTSWAPVFTLRTPGTAAKTIPPSMATSSTPTQVDGPGEEVEVQRRPRRRHHRHEVLAFDPDVEQPPLEAHGDRERREDERRRDGEDVRRSSSQSRTSTRRSRRTPRAGSRRSRHDQHGTEQRGR